MICSTAYVHPLAHVDTNCTVYGGAKVWQFASVTRWAAIGNGAVLAPGAMVDGSIIGDGAKIGPGVKMGPGFRIGPRVFLGPNVVLCNDLWPRAHHDGFDFEALAEGKIVCVEIQEGASVGANATILPGVRIGERAFVAAGSVCDRDVPADSIFTRDGRIRPLHPGLERRRMRAVRPA